MEVEASGRRLPPLRLGHVALVAIGAVLVGVFSTWVSAEPVTLSGIEGPNDGWLVVILALCSIGWARLMVRGWWVGVAGVLVAALVIVWTAAADWRDARDVLDADVGHGLLLVLAGGVVLAGTAAAAAAGLRRPQESSMEAPQAGPR